MKLKSYQPGYRCQYCKKEVGYVGRVLAALFGTGIHKCDGSNVAAWEDEPEGQPVTVKLNVDAAGASGAEEIRRMVNESVKAGLQMYHEDFLKRQVKNPGIAPSNAAVDFREAKIRNLEIDRDNSHQKTAILLLVGVTVGLFTGGGSYGPAITALVIYLIFSWSVRRKKTAVPNG